jgi:hypothetical protein
VNHILECANDRVENDDEFQIICENYQFLMKKHISEIIARKDENQKAGT